MHNLQGDVIGIFDSVGEDTIVRYTYDEWGKVLTITGDQANTIGQLNPIRYRGYYYDAESGFYYCRSRYYDPETGRFINADGYVSTGQGILSNNMFAYCGNNPVNYMDPTGQSLVEIWEGIKSSAAETWKVMKSMGSAYSGFCSMSLADGALPFGDVVTIVGVTVLTATAIVAGTYTAITAPAISVPKSKEKVQEKAEVTVVPKKLDSPVVFPVNPNTFNPVGLVKVPRDGSKNGAFISWMDPHTNTEVFRWDENTNYSNGAHYHIYGTGHYYPGMIVPEPYATIYFP